MSQVTIACDTGPFAASLASLERVFHLAPEVVERFLRALDSLSDLFSIDTDGGIAGGAGEVRIFFKASDRLADFLSAFWAGNR